jgi:hypothetical protein
MKSLRFFAGLLAVVAIFASASFALAQPAPAALQAGSSDAAGVRVVVQPRTNAPVDGKWEFDISMDTHIKPLNDDLVRASVLIDDAGHHHTPLAWQGSPSGGHHRRGVLQFRYQDARPKSIELQIEGVGGGEKRVFQWQLD